PRLRRPLFPANSFSHHRLSPLLLSPPFPHQPGFSAHPRPGRLAVRSEGATLVGRAPPPSPPMVRSRGRPSLAHGSGLLVESSRLDPLPQVRRDSIRCDS